MIFLLIFIVGSFSCGTTDPPSTRNTISAFIDDVTWSAISVKASREGRRLCIEGESTIGITIRLALMGDTLGTYLLGEGLHEGELQDEGQTWNAHGTRSGSLTLETMTEERITGFFGFRVKDTSGVSSSREITSGRFDVDIAQ